MTERLCLLACLLACARAFGADLPRAASINLCTDQLLLSVADPDQVLTVSWLSADPEESLLAERASSYPLNYGSAEELLRLSPDVIVAGTLTSPFTRKLLENLGLNVVEIAPADSIADIARNLRQVAAAIDRTEQGERLIGEMSARAAAIRSRRPDRRVAAIVLRPGGFTVGANSLADDLMRLAGIGNIAAEGGLDRWGSLSIEALVASRPELLLHTGYRRDQASLANGVFDHPALTVLGRSIATAEISARYWACGLPQSLESADLMQRAAESR